MIRIYPSRLPGDPLETHRHDRCTIDGWMQANVPSYTADADHPIEFEVDGEKVEPADWESTFIDPESDVCVYPIPYAEGAAAVVYWIVVVVFAAYAIYMANNLPNSRSQQGERLELDTVKANTARLGSPIREILGRYRVYPDYLLQPVSRFLSQKTYQTSMLVAVGAGDHVIPPGQARIGNTPISAFGGDVQMTIYPPGADVGSDPRSENWVNSTEVGATASGTSGLDLSETANLSTGLNADSITVSGNTVTLNNATITGADGRERPATSVPNSWIPGAILTVKAAANFVATDSGLYTVIAGSAIAELNPFVGMPVLVTYSGADYALFITSYAAGTPAIPGTGGTPARVTGSAAASNFDYSGAPVTFNFTWKGIAYNVALEANYITLGVLLTAINDQINDSGLVAIQSGGVVSVLEAESPYAGGTITFSGLPSGVFGPAPFSTTGTATTGGTPATQPRITMAYDSPTGTAFGGLPAGQISMAIGRGNSEYRIVNVSGFNLTMQRLTEAGVVDSGWPGWTNRTSTEYQVTGLVENETWLGPFLVCPDGEVTDAFEYDFNFPSGLIWYTDKGNKRTFTVALRVQYRVYGSGSAWTTVSHSYTATSDDGIGFTNRVPLATPGQIEVRVRRVTERGGNQAKDACFWQGLRARLLQRPTSYPGLTTIGITVTTGTKLAAQSDRRFNVLATRQYAQGTPRTISAAMIHIAKSLGMADDQIDFETLAYLEETFWTPRSEYFDYPAEKSGSSALEVLQLASQAGMGYFLLDDSRISAGREGIKAWTGGITPQRQIDQLTTAFTAPGPDDFDGVDIKYIDQVTWATETVECRLPGVPTPLKVETYELMGVGTRDRAYRIGMRRLMKHQGQRLTYNTRTEMMGLRFQYGERIKLTDDIPGSTTTSTVIEHAEQQGTLILIEVGEKLDWNLAAPRVLVRFQDGSLSGVIVPTRVSDYSFTISGSSLPAVNSFSTWILNDPIIDMPEVIFCDSSRAGYDAVISELEPGDDGTVDVTALQYDPSFYQYDDASAP